MSKLQQILGICSLILFAIVIPIIVGSFTHSFGWQMLSQFAGLIFHCIMCGIFIGTDKIMTTSELYGIVPEQSIDKTNDTESLVK